KGAAARSRRRRDTGSHQEKRSEDAAKKRELLNLFGRDYRADGGRGGLEQRRRFGDQDLLSRSRHVHIDVQCAGLARVERDARVSVIGEAFGADDQFIFTRGDCGDDVLAMSFGDGLTAELARTAFQNQLSAGDHSTGRVGDGSAEGGGSYLGESWQRQ